MKLGDCTAIVAIHNEVAVGFIKFGSKMLYIYRKDGKVVEYPQAPCILDFYVSVELQRSGIGHALFTRALEVIRVPIRFLSSFLIFFIDGVRKQVLRVPGPHCVAYDRPSPKLVAFLARHCELRNGDLQPNRFMIFDGFI